MTPKQIKRVRVIRIMAALLALPLAVLIGWHLTSYWLIFAIGVLMFMSVTVGACTIALDPQVTGRQRK